VLSSAPVVRAFQDADIALVRADWTRRDDAIARALEALGRSGVPVYALYPADPAAPPVLLPSVLTNDIVLDALDRLAPARAQ
jgi:thiol:disulfide interchange protein